LTGKKTIIFNIDPLDGRFCARLFSFAQTVYVIHNAAGRQKMSKNRP